MGTTTETRITSTQAKDAIYKAYELVGQDLVTQSELTTAIEAIDEKVTSLENIVGVSISTDLYDSSTTTRGAFINQINAQWSDANYSVTDFIYIKDLIAIETGSYSRFFNYYTEEKAFISCTQNAPAFTKITIPTNAAYVRASLYYTEVEKFYLKKYQIASTTDYSTIATQFYVPLGKEYNFYNENIMKNFKRFQGRSYITMAHPTTNWKESTISTKFINNGTVGYSNIAGNLVSVCDDEFNFLEKKAFKVQVVPTSTNTAVSILNIGDSFTYRMTYSDVLTGTTGAKNNVTFNGIRKSSFSTTPINCEGRGGWTLENYFTVDYLSLYSPFMQPINNYLYYGRLSYWIDANSVTPSYDAANFTTTKLLFDATTGYKLSPNVNDVMHNGTDYTVWNGSAWVTISEATLGGFSFNFAKYRTAWNQPVSTIVHILLGTNDFGRLSIPTFEAKKAQFFTQYDEMIASIRADMPSCKIIVGVPCTSGKQGKYGNYTTEQRKLMYFMAAQQFFNKYCEREAENIFVADYHTTVDRMYGFDATNITPYAEYTGGLADTVRYMSDPVHLSVSGFTQMGITYLGLIQKARSV